MFEIDKIYNQDCLVGMESLPDKSIDLILTDPPYGKKADKGTNGFGRSANRRYSTSRKLPDWIIHDREQRELLALALECEKRELL